VGGEVKIGMPKVTGLDRDAVKEALAARTDELRRCYEKELLTNPSLEGTVEVHLSIDPDGSADASASGIGNAALESCVTETVEKVELGRPAGRAQANVRITFSPE
jgi:hypothetical protein